MNDRGAAGHASRGTPMVMEGQDVYTLDREKLGTVKEVTGDYFTVRRGMIHSDLYIPLEDLHELRVETEGGSGTIIVNAVRDEVEMKGWQDPPLRRNHPSQSPTRP